jgi:hypothetical protein
MITTIGALLEIARALAIYDTLDRYCPMERDGRALLDATLKVGACAAHMGLIDSELQGEIERAAEHFRAVMNGPASEFNIQRIEDAGKAVTVQIKRIERCVFAPGEQMIHVQAVQEEW